MDTSWLSYYTASLQPGQLETTSAHQAFTVYARWRSLRRWSAKRYDAWRETRQRRATRRALANLSDHLLWDIGLERVGTDTRLRRPHASNTSPLMPPVRSIAPLHRPPIQNAAIAPSVRHARRSTSSAIETVRSACREASCFGSLTSLSTP